MSGFAKVDETVMGSWRVIRGTLTLTDGSAGDDVDTGMNHVIAAFSNESATERLTHSAANINAITAASGAAIDVVVLGV